MMVAHETNQTVKKTEHYGKRARSDLCSCSEIASLRFDVTRARFGGERRHELASWASGKKKPAEAGFHGPGFMTPA